MSNVFFLLMEQKRGMERYHSGLKLEKIGAILCNHITNLIFFMNIAYFLQKLFEKSTF